MTTVQKLKTVFRILKHKSYVLWYIFAFCFSLIKRGLKHDLTKFSKEEFEYVYKMGELGKSVKFGSKEYYDLVDSTMSAKIAHYTKNSHHIEYHFNDITKMSPIDLIEMLADWKSATKQKSGDIKESFKINSKKYNISYDLIQSLERDMGESNLWNS